MICLKTWKCKSSKDYKYYKSWVNFVNRNIKFAKEKSKTFDFIGKCDPKDLPSFHPYWKNVVNKDRKIQLKKLEAQYEECKNNPDKIKYYFNLSTSLDDINKRIDKLKLQISL